MWKSFSLIILFACQFHASFGQFQFRAPNEMLHYRIDFVHSSLSKESKDGSWEQVGNLTLDQVNVLELPFNAPLNVFTFHEQLLVTIPGTGQVYELDLDKMRLSRLDKTFYRGYNFQAIQYVRHDTLFSLGGMGFWHANNVLTYFSFAKKEWELASTPNELGPRWLRNDFGGYDEKRNVISAIEFPSLYDAKNQSTHFRYFEKSIHQNAWNHLGEVNVALLHKLGITRLESIFLNGNYFFLNGPMLVWADPQTNQLYQVHSLIPMFNLNFEMGFKNGYLYSYHKNSDPVKLDGRIQIDSISIEKLKSLSTAKGEFYIVPYSEDFWISGGLALLVAVTGIFYSLYRKRSKIIPENTPEQLDGLPMGASDFLLACLQFPKGFAFSSQHFTELMGYGSYAYETQRQVRSKMIKGINSYFWVRYRMKDLIIRKTAKDDKRFSVYLISEEHYLTLKSLLAKN